MNYAEARAAVAETLGPRWDAPGTFYAAVSGFEDARGYLVPCGAREWLVDRDRAFLVLDDRIVFVDKTTGDITESSYMLEMDRVDRMRPVTTTP